MCVLGLSFRRRERLETKKIKTCEINFDMFLGSFEAHFLIPRGPCLFPKQPDIVNLTGYMCIILDAL